MKKYDDIEFKKKTLNIKYLNKMIQNTFSSGLKKLK